MASLDERVERLEFYISLLQNLVDPEMAPFLYHVLEARLSREQLDAIYKLMDEVQDGIRQGNPMNHADFEQRIYDIVPSKSGDYHFAESIVSTLNREHRYIGVYKHMKADGMNI